MDIGYYNIYQHTQNLGFRKTNSTPKNNVEITTNWSSTKVTKPENKTNQDNAIIKIAFLSKNNTNALSDNVLKIAENKKILKDIGCTPLTGVAESGFGKAKSISENLKNTLKGFYTELNSILQDEKLSETEKKEKIKLLEAKQEAVIKEANTKILALLKITDTLLRIAPTIIQLKEQGLDTKEMTDSLTELVNKVDSQPTKFNNSKDIDEVKELGNDKIKNLFGNNTEKMFKEEIDKYKAKENELKTKLNNKEISNEERKKLETELKAYTIIRELYEIFNKELKK